MPSIIDLKYCLFCLKGPLIGDYRKKFCNRSCAATYNGNKFPKRKSCPEFSCKDCGIPSSLRKNPRGGYFKKSYCPQCLGIRRLAKLSCNDNFERLSKGELYKRRKNWQSANSALRKHSRKVYLISCQQKICKFCGYDKHVEICHIKQIKDYSDDVLISVINSLDNLMALCPNCHWEYDNKICSAPTLNY